MKVSGYVSLLVVIVLLAFTGCQDVEITDRNIDNEEMLDEEVELETDDIVAEEAEETEEAKETGDVVEDTLAEEVEDEIETPDQVATEEEIQEAKRMEMERELYKSGFSPGTYRFDRVFEETNFSRPLLMTSVFPGSNLVFIVERGGRVLRVDKDSGKSDVFMDLSGIVDVSQNETGLLGLAFAPDYPRDMRAFVYYTDLAGTKVGVMRTNFDNGMLMAEVESLVTILAFEQPFVNHNGGHIAFGLDGYLYIGSGDGGSGGDPSNKAQNLSNPLGKILRIDVGKSYDFNVSEGYRIPEDNPFAGQEDVMEEIYAYGLRNPWKYSFDSLRRILLAADVGQDAVEEINVIVAGGNYGWSRYEGSLLYKDIEIGEAIFPIYEYEHPLGQSITGGYTYYGDDLPSLYGVYVYGDFMTGRIWGLWIHEDGSTVNELLGETDMRISSFGLDGDGEIYVIDYQGGIYRIIEN